jgi:hypothetical protein
LLDELPRYAMPALFQDLTKPTPPFLSYVIVVVLRVELEHVLLEMPPEILNRVEIR